MERTSMSAEKKTRIAYICALVTICFALFVGVLTAIGSNTLLPLTLGIGALIYGPICLIAYLVEIKRGVFKLEDGEAEKDE